MTTRLLFAAALLGTALGSAQAQTKKELVQKVVALQQASVESMARGIAAQTSAQVLQAAARGVQQLPADKRQEAADKVRDEVQKFYNEIEPVLRQQAVKLAPSALGPKLEEKFTEDELKQVIAWFDSSAAKKFQELGPDLQKGLTEMVVADTRPTVEPKLKSLEQALVKLLGPAPGAPRASGAAGPRASAPRN